MNDQVDRRTYNYLVSFGADCACANALKGRGLRQMALPFDWVKSHSLRGLVDFVLDGPRGIRIALDAQRRAPVRAAAARVIPKYGLSYAPPHGDPVFSPMCRAELVRRADRLFDLLRTGRPTLFLRRVDRPISDAIVREQTARLKRKYPAADLAVVTPEGWETFLGRCDFDLAPVPSAARV